MASFARWLREAVKLPQSDQSAAVCATPPHLEGALISRLSKNKLCDDIEHLDPTEPNDANPKENTIASDSNEKFETIVEDNAYVDKQDGLDDELYDEELDVPSEDDLPLSKSKVSRQWSLLANCHSIIFYDFF